MFNGEVPTVRSFGVRVARGDGRARAWVSVRDDAKKDLCITRRRLSIIKASPRADSREARRRRITPLGFYNRTEDTTTPRASVADDDDDVAVYASPFAGDAAFPDPPRFAAISPSTASARSVR